MAEGLYDYLNNWPAMPQAGSPLTPLPVAQQSGPINYIPGTQWPADTAQRFGIQKKEDYDAYNAMLWRESGGRSGAPMPPPPAPDPRLAAARLRDNAVLARANTFGAPGSASQRTGATVYSGANPVVQRVLGAPLIQPGMTSVTKSQPQAQRINDTVNRFSTGPVATTKANSLTQFTADFLEDRKRQKEAYDQESGFIDRTYRADGLESDLRGLSRQRQLLARQAAESAIRRAGRDRSISSMVGGGVGSSYLDRAYGDNLMRILTEQAVTGNTMDRENAMYLQGQRGGMVGTRATLGRNYTNAALDPYRQYTDLEAQELANVGRIGNLVDNNTLYDYVRPDEAARRNLGMLDDLDETYQYYGR